MITGGYPFTVLDKKKQAFWLLVTTIPDVRGSSAKIKAELDEATFERQRNEVSTRTFDVAVVEDETVVGGRLDDHLYVGEW